MQVVMAEHFGMCFGVRDAIDLALGLTGQGPLTILGELVHNPDVVARLDAAGARRAHRREEVQTRTVLLTAHGTADRVKLLLRDEGLEVHDAGDPNRALEPGMVITDEPGIYIPEEKIGVRIEDDALITTTGYKLLTARLPRSVNEIEKIMAEAEIEREGKSASQ